jgi:hypothetical protein
MSNQKIQDIHVILGCFGLTEDSFVQCLAVENKILSVNKKTIGYPEMMDWFDRYKLFEDPFLDSNGIRNFLSLFRENFDRIDQRLWSEAKFRQIFSFIQNHKLCGLYLKLAFSFEPKLPKNVLIETGPKIPINKTLNHKDVVSKIKLFKQIERKNK